MNADSRCIDNIDNVDDIDNIDKIVYASKTLSVGTCLHRSYLNVKIINSLQT